MAGADSVLGLSGLFYQYTRSNDVADGSQLLYSWQARIKSAHDTNEVECILEARCLEVRQLHQDTETTEGEKCRLEREWVALVMAKDKNLRLKFEQENERMKKFYMKQLHTTLELLGSFNFNKPNETILRRNLAKIYQQVGLYCSKNSIEQGGIKPAVKCSPKAELSSAPPPPPPPPLPPPAPKYTNPEKTQIVQAHKRRKVLSTIESDGARSQQRTPLKCINEELMNRIQGSKNSYLRSTPCKRSPGGTPMRRQRRLSESDTSDLITVALRRKFKNVTLQSPNENVSPNAVRSPATDF